MFFYLLAYSSILIIDFLYIRRNIIKRGFNCMNMFVISYSVFYMVTPFMATLFRNSILGLTLYTKQLSTQSDEKIFINFLFCSILLFIIIYFYHLKNNREIRYDTLDESLTRNGILDVESKVYKNIQLIADVFLALGVISIVPLIIAVGGIGPYLALGSATRGLESSATNYISANMLPLITLSQVILIPSYIYYYLVKVNKSLGYECNKLEWKFRISFVLAILYLMYNQGRAPLLLFVLPFILTSNWMRKMKILGLFILFIICFVLLDYLNGLFLYLSYGIFRTDNRTMISTFLLEYSYPFTNFVIRDQLISLVGYRYLYDYYIWIINVIPSFLLSIIGITKGKTPVIGSLNTQAYSLLYLSPVSGGIPADILTFHYYQGGYITLIIAVIFIALILRIIDSYYLMQKDNIPIQILLYRISISVFNFMTNSDFSVIARTRMDIIFLCIVVIYITKKTVIPRLDSKKVT